MNCVDYGEEPSLGFTSGISFSANRIYQVSERMVGIIGRQVLVSMIRLLQLFQLAFMFLPDCETSATGPTTNKCSKSGMWVGGEGRRFTLVSATAWSLELFAEWWLNDLCHSCLLIIRSFLEPCLFIGGENS